MERGTKLVWFKILNVVSPHPLVDVQPNFGITPFFGKFRSVPDGVPVVPTFLRVMSDLERLIDEFRMDRYPGDDLPL